MAFPHNQKVEIARKVFQILVLTVLVFLLLLGHYEGWRAFVHFLALFGASYLLGWEIQRFFDLLKITEPELEEFEEKANLEK